MPLGDDMPDIPDDFNFEPLFRAKVRDEQAGFEQCRKRVLGRIDELLNELEPESPWQDPESRCMREALTDLKAWIKGQVPGQ